MNCKTRRESLWLCVYISAVNGIAGAEPRILTGNNDSGEGDELMVLDKDEYELKRLHEGASVSLSSYEI